MSNFALEKEAVNVVRALGMDGPHAARSGHQGTAMALAPLAHVLWTRVLNYDATDPAWPDGIALFCRPGTPQCCCTPCFTSPATG